MNARRGATLSSSSLAARTPMKKPSLASQKKVNAENLESLGVQRLTQILLEVAETRTDLKRRLRMELAAGLGAVHLVAEIDKRLGALETSRGQVAWRHKPAFLRDLDALRGLIAERLAGQEPEAALERLWRFLASARHTSKRLRERDEAFEAIYLRAAEDLGRHLAGADAQLAAHALLDAMSQQPQAWAAWAPRLVAGAPQALARTALPLAQAKVGASPGWIAIVRALADGAGDIEAYRATHTPAALATPSIAVEVAMRYSAAGDIAAAGHALRLAAPRPTGLRGRLAAPDFAWETAWIDYLEASGDMAAAQAVRWASFQRTLDVDRARAFASRLTGFEDVDAETTAFGYAARHKDFTAALNFLMAWPALPEANAMILARRNEVQLPPDKAELWAGKLRKRFPQAAEILLRKGAASAFKRREFKLSDRLTEEADAIAV